MAKVIFRQEAIDDLNDIWIYTFEEWSEKQADKYYATLEFACMQIGENSELPDMTLDALVEAANRPNHGKQGIIGGSKVLPKASFDWAFVQWFNICSSIELLC